MNIYVYPYSRDAARRDGDMDIWARSYAENIACAKEINEEIARSFDGYHLDKNAAKNVIGKFGFDRVNWVLTATVQQKDHDGRFSETNKKWASDTFMGYLKEEMRDYLIDSHPAVLDGFINQTRRIYGELGLFESGHCTENHHQQNYVGKVLVLNPTILKDECKSPENQLILGTGGFGCNPTASGRKIYGVFLADGEKCQYNRADFLGALKDEHLPAWAQEKLVQMQAEQENTSLTQAGSEEAPGFSMEMR